MRIDRLLITLAIGLFAGAGVGASAAPATVAAVFDERTLVSYVVEVEAALARAQAAEGVIPKAAAAEITRTAVLETIPADALEAENDRVRHRMVALLNVWRRSLSPEAADFLHFGATTVDIYDTAAVLQLRDATKLLIDDMLAIEAALVTLAQQHRDTPMIGRTLGQHALPITYGKRLSVYIDENRRHVLRLQQLDADLRRSAIMKGAVGTYLGLGDRAIEVESRFSRELGLAEPFAGDWHGSRDVFADYALTLGLISRTWARFGQDVFLLQSTDIGEVRERVAESAVGSSSMPQKSNPSLSEALIHRGRTIPRMAEALADDVINFHERDNTSRPNELLGEVVIEAAGMLQDTRRLIGRLEVNTDAMRQNMARTDGLIMAQRLVFALGAKIGRVEAEEVIRALATKAIKEEQNFAAIVRADPRVSAALSEKDIAAALDPATYIGLAPQQVDRVLNAARTPLPGP